jgi:hypothetical protein
MTGSHDDAPAARGPPLGARARRPEGRESSRAWRPADFPAQSRFTGCTVRYHEDVPRHIYWLFQALGVQYRWVLTRGSLGREILKAEDLVIDNAKEQSWMTVYEHERDLLEDTVYRRLVSLWSEFSDAYAVFDQHGPVYLLCTQQVWEALLADFGDIRRAFDYMGALTIDDVFRSVILATLKSSTNRALRTAYDQILYDLDDDKDLTFAHIQTVCARQFRRTKKWQSYPPPRADTPRATPRTSPVKPEQYNKYKRQGGNDLAVFLCNTLEQHGEHPGKVLRRAGLAGVEWNEPASVTALFMAAQKHFPRSVPSDTDDDNDTDYDAAAAYESDDWTWVSYGKRSFSVTPCARPTRVNTERLAERETLLHRLGSKLNRTVFNSCRNPIIRSAKTRDFSRSQVFCANRAIHTKKEAKKGSWLFLETPNK